MKKRCRFPIILSFDVDGETLWTARDPENERRPVQLSMGQYGPRVGVDRILDLLGKHGLRATFFVPGKTAERYGDIVKSIHDLGHEIANHSYSHRWPDSYKTKEEEKDELEKTSEVIYRLTKTTPIGYRSPAWEFSSHTVSILEEMGFTYSSNMMGCDEIHRLSVFDKKTDIVEIPVNWVLDDAAYWLYSVRTPGKSMQSLSAVLEYWQEEFTGMYEEEKRDNCFMLTCHPQVIGRPARMRLLDRFIRFIKDHSSVEFVTCADIALEYDKIMPKNT